MIDVNLNNAFSDRTGERLNDCRSERTIDYEKPSVLIV